MSDPIEDALKAVAHAEASRDFAARVRARIDAGQQVRVAWRPRVAAACAAVVLVAAMSWWARDQPGSPEQVAIPVTPAAAVRPQPSAPQLEPRADRLDVTGRTPVAGVTVVRARSARPRASDHDRALPPLPLLDGLSVSSIAPDAMVLDERVVPPLAPIAPISASHGEAGDDERGKL